MFSAAPTLVRFLSCVVIAVLAIGACSMATSDPTANASIGTVKNPSTGLIALDGVDYPFTPETCFVGNERFVASGAGSMDGEAYRVSASPSVVEITFGVAEEGAAVPEGSRWLSTVDVIDWTSAGQQVAATVELFERKSQGTGKSWAASLALNCVEGS